MKKTFACMTLIVSLSTFPLAHAQGSPSEVSAASILVTGSLVLIASTLPLIALDSLLDCSVGEVKPAGNKMTDIEVRPKKSEKIAVIRVPDQALDGKSVKPGQKAELIADANGHTLRIENKPIAYVPGKAADQLLHNKPLK